MKINEDHKGEYANALSKVVDTAEDLTEYIKRTELNNERLRDMNRALDRAYEDLKKSRQSYLEL